MTNQTEIVAALRTLGVTSQTLLDRIRTALERGLVDEALVQLAFVDELVATRDERDALESEKAANPNWVTSAEMQKRAVYAESKLAALLGGVPMSTPTHLDGLPQPDGGKL